MFKKSIGNVSSMFLQHIRLNISVLMVTMMMIKGLRRLRENYEERKEFNTAQMRQV